jgi:twitching motility two-component system response regulator PilG
MTDILTTHLPSGRRSSRGAEPAAGVHVLVADAEGSTRTAREQQLRAAGHRVSLARTAFEALVKATCHLPDIILLDLSLPDIATHDTIKFLSTCPVTAHIPVTQLSPGRSVPQRIMGELRRRARQAGLSSRS